MQNSYFGSALAFLLFSSTSALAQEVANAELPELSVQGASAGSLTVPSVAAQRATVNATVGSVAFVDAKDFQNRYANTLRDVLKDTPGVFVQQRYGQEMRLSLRGSGISRGFHLRGIELLQDGFPVNAADGSGDFYQIDPLALRSVEVYKGGNALTYGATTLGGAINFRDTDGADRPCAKRRARRWRQLWYDPRAFPVLAFIRTSRFPHQWYDHQC